MAFAVFLAVVCFVRAAVDPGRPLWLLLGVICVVMVAGGLTAILVQRRDAIKKTGRWP